MTDRFRAALADIAAVTERLDPGSVDAACAMIAAARTIAVTGGGREGLQIKGFAMGLLGLLLATIGQERQSGTLRFDFGLVYLWEGLDLIPVLVGIFAIPEIVDLAVRGTAIAGERPPARLGAGVWQGIKDTFIHFWLVVRCAVVMAPSNTATGEASDATRRPGSGWCGG